MKKRVTVGIIVILMLQGVLLNVYGGDTDDFVVPVDATGLIYTGRYHSQSYNWQRIILPSGSIIHYRGKILVFRSKNCIPPPARQQPENVCSSSTQLSRAGQDDRSSNTLESPRHRHVLRLTALRRCNMCRWQKSVFHEKGSRYRVFFQGRLWIERRDYTTRR